LVSSSAVLLLDDGPLFLADTTMNVDPDAEQLAAITEACMDLVRQFGVKPKVALLSHSNFGTSNAPSAKKVRAAAAILRETHSDIQIDGEMHVLSALNPALRKTVYPQSNLSGRANVLVMPNLDAANIAMGLIRSLTDGLLIGPFINGLAKPAHIVLPSVTSRGIFNMTALTVADIQQGK
jgi:malate dehydrogenase (oxaloacetate-decarboxylating)(NADP+)